MELIAAKNHKASLNSLVQTAVPFEPSTVIGLPQPQNVLPHPQLFFENLYMSAPPDPFFNPYAQDFPTPYFYENPYETKTIIKNAYSLAKDQSGCRMLQKKLEERNSYVTSQIFEKIVNHLPELVMDPFGNYLSQKLFEVIDL